MVTLLISWNFGRRLESVNSIMGHLVDHKRQSGVESRQMSESASTLIDSKWAKSGFHGRNFAGHSRKSNSFGWIRKQFLVSNDFAVGILFHHIHEFTKAIGNGESQQADVEIKSV